MQDNDIHEMMTILRREAPKWGRPYVTSLAEERRDPFRVLIATVLIARTQDTTTGPAARRLFALADTPQAMLRLSPEQIEQVIYPVGFYHHKAQIVPQLCQALIELHGGQVPPALDALIALPGVGRKTANLVLTLGFHLPGICVDTHVHRITNHWGYVQTQTPEQTEMALRAKLPPEYWIEINDLLVAMGQTI